MTVRLRPHHLLCVLTFSGKGYTHAFSVNFDSIAKRLDQGEAVMIVAGPDDICAPLLSCVDAHYRRESVAKRDEHAMRSVSEALSWPIRIGEQTQLSPQVIKGLREAFSSGRIRGACFGCQWTDIFCSVAANCYREAVIPSER